MEQRSTTAKGARSSRSGRATPPPAPAPHPAMVTFDLWNTVLQISPRAARRYEQEIERVWCEQVALWPLRHDLVRTPVPIEEAVAQTLRLVREHARGGKGLSIARRAGMVGEATGRIPQYQRLERELERTLRGLPVRIAPGARALLEELSRSGVQVGFVSNLMREPASVMRGLLAEHGLLRYADALALSEELPWAKPSPRIFLHCLEAAGAPPNRAVHVGEAPEDVEGAVAAGYRRVVRILRSSPGPKSAHGGGRRSSCATEVTCAAQLRDLSVRLLLDEGGPSPARARALGRSRATP